MAVHGHNNNHNNNKTTTKATATIITHRHNSDEDRNNNKSLMSRFPKTFKPFKSEAGSDRILTRIIRKRITAKRKRRITTQATIVFYPRTITTTITNGITNIY